MKNKKVGYLIVSISIVIGIIIYLFNRALKEIVSESCSHGTTCPMYGDIKTQTLVSVVLVSAIFIVGIILILNKEKEKIIVKRVRTRKKKISLEGLDSREKEAVKLIQKNGGIFQSELMEKLNIGKVGLTRLLDKLESKQIVERKRRGMNNFIVLKG